jgi:O-antigen/teichoic acid export membrane protein
MWGIGMNEKEDIKGKVVSGLAWTYAERILAQGISFIVSIILARLLMPQQYGTVAIVTIFITLFNVFVISGLGSSLIQKKNADSLDFSTAFYSGLVISILLYCLLFALAPLIASFYNMDDLAVFIRVLGIQLPLSSVNSVQQAYVSKKLIFKKFFFSTLFGNGVSAIIGIAMAYNGFGTWSLIFQYLINAFINTIILFFILPWRPKKEFSIVRFKSLFSYGWKILASDLIQTLYNDLRGLAIGKKYSPSDLSYYNRGQHFTSLIVTNVDASITKVLFPAISACQDDTIVVKNMTRRSIKISSFIMAPLLIGLAIVAEPLILLMLTEKWIHTVPYLQILCLANLFQPMHSANLQAIKAIGHSDVTLKLEIVKKSYSIIILILSIVLFNDPFAVAIGFVLSTFISVIVNAFPNKKLLNYGFIEQLRDILPHILIAFIMGGLVYAVGLIRLTIILSLSLQVIVGIIAYLGISKLFKIESLTYVYKIVNDVIANARYKVSKLER